MPILKKVNQNFFKTWSPNVAYILGFFVADGSMSKNKRGAHFIEIEITDKDLLEGIRRVLGSNHRISSRKRETSKKTAYRLQVGSKVIFQDLLALGVTPKKSKTIAMPAVPEEFLGDFVRGYFDGDGCVQMGRYWRKDREQWKWQFSTSFTSGSRDFLVGLWERIERHFKGGHIGDKSGGYELVFGQQGSVALFRLMYNNPLEDMFLERKYRTFQRAFKILSIADVV